RFCRFSKSSKSVGLGRLENPLGFQPFRRSRFKCERAAVLSHSSGVLTACAQEAASCAQKFGKPRPSKDDVAGAVSLRQRLLLEELKIGIVQHGQKRRKGNARKLARIGARAKPAALLGAQVEVAG